MKLHFLFLLIITGITVFSSSLLSQPAQALETSSSQPTPQLLVINQTRGEECCDPGSLSALESQLNATIATQIPTHFALRYDALTNPTYIKLLKTAQTNHPSLFSFGALIEVTPALAQAAGVTYTGTPDTWFQAKHVLTMGYAPTDRTKLLDTLWSQFYTQFGSYPALSTAWMLDTPSLNYLHQTYNLQVHQITREQAGTDSYHLIGGPPHYPYPASSNWLFIPDYERASAPLIVRQTVTDPLRNYGDTTNAFTSQPNDFRLDGKDFSYFEKLITQALFGSPTTPQYPTGFALIGLENSMPPADQATFVKQLEYVAPWIQEGRVTTPNLTELTTFWRNQSLSLYSGTDLTGPANSNQTSSSTAVWITTPHYRLRLRHQAGQNFISDIRAYNPDWLDPYTSHTATNQAIWIVPYLIDGATWYELPPTQTGLSQLTHQFFAKHLKPPSPPRFSPEPHHDTNTVPHQLQLAPTSTPFQLATASAHQLNLSSSEISLTITADTWQRSQSPATQLPATSSPAPWPELVTTLLSCQTPTNCQSSFTTGSAEVLELSRLKHYQLLFPELTTKPIALNKSVFYVHNHYAIANRNPIRAVFMPVDELGYPTLPEPAPSITTSSPTTTVVTSTDPQSSALSFIDISNTEAEKITITVTTPGSQPRQETVYFAPNCKSKKIHCLTHPRQTWWFIKVLILDKVRSLSEKL